MLYQFLILFLVSVSICFLTITKLNGQFVYHEGFTSNTAPGWEFTTDGSGSSPGPRLTAGEAPNTNDPEYASGASEIDADNLGWLRLATVTNNQANAVALDTAIPSSGNNIKVSFDFTMWKPGTADPADGITVFMWDASKIFDPGAFGGSLGYAQRTGINGLAGAYVGVALDVWGNFSEDDEGRTGAVDMSLADPTTGPAIDIPDSGGGGALAANENQIVVRGPDDSASGDGTGNYFYLGGTGLNNFTTDTDGDTNWDQPISDLSDSITFNNYDDRPDQDAVDYRFLEMELTDADQLIIRLKAGYTGTLAELFTLDLSDSYFDRPDQLRIGFAASTGGSLNVHEIRNLTIEASGGDNSFYWDNSDGDQLWSTGANWDQGTIPTANSHIIFSDGFDDTKTDHTVSIDGANKIQHSITFSGSTSFTLGPSGSQTIDMDTGATGDSYLNILNSPNGNADQTINAGLIQSNDLKVQNLVDQTLTLGGGIDTKGYQLLVNSEGTTLISGVISDTGDLTKSGLGTLRLSGTNTYTGTTTVEEGMIQLESVNALGGTSGTATVEDGATLGLSGNILVASGQTVTITGNGYNDLGALRSVSGTNRWRGDITLSDDATIGVDNGADFTHGNNGIIDAAGFDLTLNVDGTALLDRSIRNSTGNSNFTKDGSGTVTLGDVNEYTGSTTLRNGTLQIDGNAPSGANGRLGNSTTALEIGDASTPAEADLSFIISDLNGGTNMARNIDVNNYGDTVILGGLNTSGTNTFSGNIAIDRDIQFSSLSGGSVNVTGIISGTGDLTKSGAGTVDFRGTNTYTGDITVSEGVIRTFNGSALDNQGSVSLATGTIWDMGNTNETVGALGGEGQITAGSATLTTGGNNLDTTLSGEITGNASSVVIKEGNGTMTFSGANTFSGTLQINNGMAVLGRNDAFNNNMDLDLNGGTFVVDGFSDMMDDFDLQASSSIDYLSNDGGDITFQNVDNAPTGTLTVDNWIGDRLNGGGDTILQFSDITGTDLTNLNTLATQTVFTGWGDFATIVTVGVDDYELVPDLSGWYEWDGDTNNAWNNNTNWRVSGSDPGDFPADRNDNVLIQDLDPNLGTNGIELNNNRTVRNMIIQNDTTFTISENRLTFDAPGNGLTTYLTVAGNSSPTFSSRLRFTDDMVVTNNSTGIVTMSGNVRLADNDGTDSSVIFRGSGTTVITGNVSDRTTNRGYITKEGTGTLRLSGNNSYGNGTTLEEGTLQIGHDNALGDGTFTIEGGIIEAYGADRTITNDLDINNLDDNAFTVTGSNDFTFSGTQTVDMPSSSLELTVDTGITATFDTDVDLTGTGELIKEGTGILELSGDNNDFGGGLTVNAGTVQSTAASAVSLGSNVGGENYLGSGHITVNSGGTINLTVTGGFDIDLDSTLSNTGGMINITATGNGSGFNLDDEIVSTGGTTNITVDDVFDMAPNTDLTVSAGTVNIDPGSFTTSNNNGDISVSNTGILNIDMSGGTGTGTFLLDDNDDLSVDGSGANIYITGSSPASAITFGGNLSLTNGGTVTVEQGTTYLDGDTNIDGGSASTAGTLVLKGDLSIDEPAISNSPNLTLDVSGTSSITAPNTGSSMTDLGTLTKTGTGTTTINGTYINNIEAAKVVIDAGSLQLGASDQIANTVDMTFQGGVFDTDGHDEIVNSLTLTETSWIDLGAGDSVLQFNSSTASGTRTAGTLVIQAWSGNEGTGGGTDQVIFGSSLSQTFLANIWWEDQAILGAKQLASGEIVPIPIPEPGTIISSILLGGLLFWHGFLFGRKHD